jgi:hypothetical protein
MYPVCTASRAEPQSISEKCANGKLRGVPLDGCRRAVGRSVSESDLKIVALDAAAQKNFPQDINGLR